jgi:hypothetical protein
VVDFVSCLTNTALIENVLIVLFVLRTEQFIFLVFLYCKLDIVGPFNCDELMKSCVFLSFPQILSILES